MTFKFMEINDNVLQFKILHYPGGNIFRGMVENDRKHGWGIMRYTDGSVYQGEYKYDERHGSGVFRWGADGDEYIGEWKNDKMNGYGTYKFSNGQRYQGDYQENKKDGKGIFTWPNGSKYEGSWKNNVMCGYGTYTWPNGNSWTGIWNNSKQDGVGVFKWSNGDYFEGEWRNGECVNGKYVLVTQTTSFNAKFDEFFRDSELTKLHLAKIVAEHEEKSKVKDREKYEQMKSTIDREIFDQRMKTLQGSLTSLTYTEVADLLVNKMGALHENMQTTTNAMNSIHTLLTNILKDMNNFTSEMASLPSLGLSECASRKIKYANLQHQIKEACAANSQSEHLKALVAERDEQREDCEKVLEHTTNQLELVREKQEAQLSRYRISITHLKTYLSSIDDLSRKDLIEDVMAAGSLFLSLLIPEQAKLEEQQKHTESLLSEYMLFKENLHSSLRYRAQINNIKEKTAFLSNRMKELKKKGSKKRHKIDFLNEHGDTEGETESRMKAQRDLEILQRELEQTKEEQLKHIQLCAELTNYGYPEMVLYCLSEQMKTGLVIERSLKDFKNTFSLTDNILVGELSGTQWVLKAFLVGQDSLSQRRFEKEVAILNKLNHPLIIKIEAIFYDGGHVFLQFPYYERGTLADWLVRVVEERDNGEEPIAKRLKTGNNNRRETWEIQCVTHQILQAISFIHRNGVVHRDLKFENILMKDEYQPILCDFDISKDTSLGGKSSSSNPGSLKFMAPELMEGKQATLTSDMWAFGVILFKCFFTDEDPVLLPDKEAVLIPPHENTNMVDLLHRILRRLPHERISAEEALCHPFFTTPAVGEMKKMNQILDLNTKLKAFRDYIHELKKQHKWNEFSSHLTIQISSSNPVESTLAVFESLNADMLLQRFYVKVEGEEGVDGGALTTHMYQKFFQHVFNSNFGLFERSEKGKVYIPAQNADPDILVTVGKILMRALLDERTVNVPLAPSVFKFLMDVKPNLRDLEVYDADLFHQFRQLLAIPNVDQWAFLDFDGLTLEGKNIPVTDQNKNTYTQLRTELLLVETRRRQLEALQSGFYTIISLNSHLRLLSPVDLQVLLTGNEFISSEMIKPLLRYIDYPPNSLTVTTFEEVLDRMDQLDLKRFLLFVTEQNTIPIDGLMNPNVHSPNPREKITVACRGSVNSLPVSHVCFYQLDLPNYGDSLNKMEERILFAIRNAQTFENL